MAGEPPPLRQMDIWRPLKVNSPIVYKDQPYINGTSLSSYCGPTPTLCVAEFEFRVIQLTFTACVANSAV